jgi:hypothetical protein
VQRKRKRNKDYLAALGFGDNNKSSMQADLNRTKAARRSTSNPSVKAAKGIKGRNEGGIKEGRLQKADSEVKVKKVGPGKGKRRTSGPQGKPTDPRPNSAQEWAFQEVKVSCVERRCVPDTCSAASFANPPIRQHRHTIDHMGEDEKGVLV